MNQERIAALHSRYNPQAEAERYIGSLALNEKTRFFILIEPGLGYMIAPLKKKVPGAKIITLHAAKPEAQVPPDAPTFSQTIPAPEPSDADWYPGTGISIQDFLEREIPDSIAAEIRILEWRPALAVYGNSYLALVQETAEFIKRSDANARTLEAFGQRWFRNFFKNLEIIKKVLCPVPLSMPLIVTCAGPGLEDAIPLIRSLAGDSKEKTERDSFFVLAVSSSAAALHAADIVPDMVISTDGGQWAAFHLLDICRYTHQSYASGAYSCPLAAALTAALPSGCEKMPVLPISDGSLWQTLVLKELNIPFIVLPQRGTVSAAALDLAFVLTRGDIFIAGLDLENRDIRSHARPYSFDRFLEEKAGKLDPVYSQAFRRSSLLKAGGSYGIYASWFEKQLAAYPKRLFSLGKNNRVFSSLGKSTLNLAPNKVPMVQHEPRTNGTTRTFQTITLEFTDNPARKAYAVLEKALKDPVHSAALRAELSPLLSGGNLSSMEPVELIEAFRSLAATRQGEASHG